MSGSGPLIVTALFGDRDFIWLDGMRRQHFPATRNQVPAHCTLFHHLAPSLESELRQRLSAATRGVRAPHARISSVLDHNTGVALRIDSPELEAIREELADAFLPMLTVQDRAGWSPHVTIQNKVTRGEARTLLETMRATFQPRPLAIVGLASWRYLGGPWEPVSRHMFA